MIGGLPSLDGIGVDDAVAGDYRDAEVSKQYREFERRGGYRIEPTAADGTGSV